MENENKSKTTLLWLALVGVAGFAGGFLLIAVGVIAMVALGWLPFL